MNHLDLAKANRNLIIKTVDWNNQTVNLAFNLEWESRFEPPTFCFGSRHSVAELLPLAIVIL
mgnify:CR=1 FL=1